MPVSMVRSLGALVQDEASALLSASASCPRGISVDSPITRRKMGDHHAARACEPQESDFEFSDDEAVINTSAAGAACSHRAQSSSKFVGHSVAPAPTTRQESASPRLARADSDSSEAEEAGFFGLFSCSDELPQAELDLQPRPDTTKLRTRKRSGLFLALLESDAGPVPDEAPAPAMRSHTAKSAPELFRRSTSCSVLDDLDPVDPGEFRSCRHCRSVFPFVRVAEPLSSGDALRFSFCSGECHLTYFTLCRVSAASRQQQQQQQRRRMGPM